MLNLNEKFYVEQLRDSENGIDVFLRGKKDGESYVIKNVHPNVVRCCIGENDVDYLLKTKTPESFCLISLAEMNDFRKHVVR